MELSINIHVTQEDLDQLEDSPLLLFLKTLSEQSTPIAEKETPEPVKPKAKAKPKAKKKKLTWPDDVQPMLDACHQHFSEAMGDSKKAMQLIKNMVNDKFDIESIRKMDEKDYGKVIAYLKEKMEDE